MVDAYGILGVSPTATDEEIHRAYKELSRKYHPDHGGNPDDMARLNEAYALVKTPELRAKYVNGNEFTVRFQWMEKVFGKSHVAEEFGKPPVDDRCGDRGSDIEVTENIPMEAFIFGKPSHVVRYTKTSECLMCSGKGGEKLVNCPRCGATGKIVFRKKEKPCPKCFGRGSVISGECQVCGGSGHTEKEVTATVDITPGLSYKELVGKGNDGPNGGPSGNLKVTINPLADEERGMEAYMSSDGFPFVNFTRRIHPEDFVLGTTLDFDVYGRLLVVTVPENTLDFWYSCPVENLCGSGVRAMVNVELAPEDDPEWARKAYSALREARNSAKSPEKT